MPKTNKPLIIRNTLSSYHFHIENWVSKYLFKHQEEQGVKFQKTFSVLFLQSYIKIFLWETKLKKNAGTKENYITTLNTLNLCLFAKVKKYFEDWVFLPFPGLKKVLRIIPANLYYTCFLHKTSFLGNPF